MLEGSHTSYGHPTLTNALTGPYPRLRKFELPSANRFLVLRDGSVGFLLCHMALWWNKEVHALNAPHDKWDEWGYAPRPTRGQTRFASEHFAGAAMDLDATRHPRGVALNRSLDSNTTTHIRNRVNDYHGCIGWGGNYHRVIDGMHFEWGQNASLSDMEHQAKLLIHTPLARIILRSNPGLLAVINS